jgi:predicted site-specific integrase-resolvase
MKFKEVMDYFRFSRSTVLRRIRSGELKAEKRNRKWVFKKPSINKFINNLAER